MRKLAVLGPKGTYSDVAAKKLMLSTKTEYEIVYFPSILKTAMAITEEMDALLPFENTLDGFVLESMDAILQMKAVILKQIKVPVSFSFVSYTDAIENVEDIFVQSKAYGQCLSFVGKNDFRVHITQSNMESVLELEKMKKSFGAIIPSHAVDNKYSLKITDVTDSVRNETRFVLVSKHSENLEPNMQYNASLLLSSLEDRPGVLYHILECFSDAHINLKAILSRPRKDEMGKYTFYIEFEIDEKDIPKLKCIESALKKDAKIISLGVYNTI